MHGSRRPARRGACRRGGGLLALVLLVGGLVAALGPPARAATAGTPPPEAFILVDAKSGAVITGRHMHEALPPASIAKIMTALVAIERLPADAPVPVSPNAANREAMKIGMQAGTTWPLEPAMASLMMVSANDSAYAIAEAVGGGSIDGFADIANQTARRYGMRDSTFGDPAGLTDGTSYKGGPQVSAYDMAIATRNALTVPGIARWAGTKDYAFTDPSGQDHTLTNHNKFLPDNGFGYIGANGFKTGYTELADHTLVATAKRGGRQCIAVILGSVDSGYTWAASLLDKCWVKPAVETTGKFLPAIAVSPYKTRVDAQAGFAKIALGRDGAALAAAKKPANATPSTTTTTAPATPPSTPPATGAGPNRAATDAGNLAAARVAGTDAASRSATKPVASSGGDGLLTTTRLVLLLLVVLAVCFVLRRRAVKRQRARRVARQRARAKAMRSGSLPVVDGKYRTGTRVGPPLDSHVRVAPSHIDLPDEERRVGTRSRNGRRTSDYGNV